MVTAEDVLATVRVYADRVHDLLRRLGCGPAAAQRVVEMSALELVTALAAGPGPLADPAAPGDPLGWWFARARDLARSCEGEPAEIAFGAGVLGGDPRQGRLGEALDARPEAERVALLLRDSYDLPAPSVGWALGLDPDGALAAVGRARLALLPLLAGGPVATLDGPAHPSDPAGLARLGEGGQVATRDATLRRHVQSCPSCGAVVGDQERARRLLRGLSVMALPERTREDLLAAVGAAAQRALPTAVPLTAGPPRDPDRAGATSRRGALSVAALAGGVLLAVMVGVFVGLVLSRSPAATTPSATDLLAAPSTEPVPTPPAAPTAPGPPPKTTGTPTTHVFTITPAPAPTVPPSKPATTASPATVAAESLALALSPAAGPSGTVVQVAGRGWTPGATLSIDYRDVLGRTTGAGAQVVVDTRGRFTTSLTADDPANLPGRHTVQARDGTHSAEAVFTSSG